jgi:hypothetical protein
MTTSTHRVPAADPPATLPEPEPRAGRKERIALAVLALPLLLVSMDVSVLYFAVPFISRDLSVSATQQLRRPRRPGHRRRHVDAVHPGADPQSVPRRRPTGQGDRGVERRDDGRHLARSGARRHPVGALLVGIGLPDQPARDDPAARARPGAAAGVQEPFAPRFRSGQLRAPSCPTRWPAGYSRSPATPLPTG